MLEAATEPLMNSRRFIFVCPGLGTDISVLDCSSGRALTDFYRKGSTQCRTRTFLSAATLHRSGSLDRSEHVKQLGLAADKNVNRCQFKPGKGPMNRRACGFWPKSCD